MEIKNGKQALKFKLASNEIFNLETKKSLVSYKENNTHASLNLIEKNHLNDFLIQQQFKLRSKRAPNDKTLVEATQKSDYTYWLSQEDITDIARIEYHSYRGIEGSNARFEVIGSLSQLYNELKAFQSNIQTTPLYTARLTSIINLGQAHWVSLVIAYDHGNYIGYYLDSKNKLIPSEYSNMLFDSFKILPFSLSPGYPQQQDAYNCSLWALENAFHLNQMLDQNQSLNWLTAQLKKPRNKDYFEARREFFSKKLRKDPIWCKRHPLFLQDLNAQKKLHRLHTMPSTSDFEPKLKQLKTTSDEKEKVTHLLETFVENFISVFIKKLSVYHLLSKEESLTEDTLKTELKTGLTAALLGVGISLSLVGSIPSLVASLRAISGKYYISKIKAQKITKIFSEFKTNYLSSILSEAAVTIFQCFESQFMQITDKAGDKVAMEKLAEDAVGRMLNAIVDYSDTNKLMITKELIEKAVLKGPSEKFFDPNVKRARLRISGYIIQNKNGDHINTANLYEKMGLVELNLNGSSRKFYVPEKYPSSKYGYRQLFDWEKEANGELKKNLQEQYIIKEFFLTEDNDHIISRNYHYVLEAASNQLEARRILNQLENQNSPSVNKEYAIKKPIYFNLIKPIKNFSGRGEILNALHKILLSERTIAIVPAWSTLSISSSSDSHSPQTSSGSQLLITGLGGIGKTQLALRYAELYAQDYDHNVLWINAETKENLAYSFYKLASKLQITNQNQYAQARTLEEITEEIYEYFSDKKSLFIFDNIENYHALEAYLPKSMPGNKPTLLITSRYTNWSNIATVLPLAVFTEQETEELISKSLDLPKSTLYESIKELNQLLQGLPLALQQAIAYIKLKKNTDSHFSIFHYIELYKKKQQQVLNFNFFDYSNDPYLKTVFTTWLVTLDKIKTYPIGKLAIDTLHIMAYLCPDHISTEKLTYLTDVHPDFKADNLAIIIHLLNSYSMLNTKDNQKNSYTIHRLVQQVIRLHVENNPSTFIKVIGNVQSLFDYWNIIYKEDNETRFHYLHFLIYMLKHNDLIPILGEHPEKKFLDALLLQNVKYFQHFIDLTYFKLPKEKFLRFMGDALAYYMKLGKFFYLREILNYLEKKWSKKLFSMENIKYITEHIHSIKNPKFKLIRFSTIPAKQANQREAITLLYNFKEKIFGNKYILYNNCPSHSLKRSICLSKIEQDKLDKFKLNNQQSIKSHFKKIGEISDYINSALMTKDTLSALLQGHFAEVAINFGLIASSKLSGKISNWLLTQGKNLAEAATLIEKNLNLENKKALHILLNNEVLSVGKRQFLGKAMQVASPFVAKATDIFFVYNLKKEIQAYNKGDRSTLPNIVSNSIILSIDGIEAGIEGTEKLLDMLIKVSAFTGPIGEWISLLTLVSTEAYMAKQQVKAIEKYVHLSRGEKIFEFLLSMLHQAPLDYLQLKANNGQRVEQVIHFLKNNTDIQWYIFPSFHFAEDLCGIRKVFLNEKIKFTQDESNPDEPAEGDLFCLSAAPPPYLTLNETIKPRYLCHKALGVSYTFNRTGNITLINLGEGDDEVIAFSDSPTLFSVQNGKKWYQGSDNGNVFDLQGSNITGLIQGGVGLDILILENFYPENSDYVLLDDFGLLCGKNYNSIHSVPPLCSLNELSLKINKIDQIFGRRHEPDIFYLNSYTHKIDGYGGKNTEQADSFFVTEHSPENIMFILRNNTLILFSPNITTYTIEYRVPANEVGETRIQTHSNEFTQHRFFFECFLTDVDSLIINNNTIHISVLNSRNRGKETFSITISVDSINSKNNQTKNTPEILKNNYFSFKDVEIKAIINEHLYVKEITSNNKTVDENINFFTELANRLKKALSIQLANNITLLIGREKKHEIFYINNLLKNYVIGNGGENVLIPFLPLKNIAFPLREITLSEISKASNFKEQAESINSLDLREIIKRYQQIHPKAMVASHVFSEATDLILTLSNAIYSPSNPNTYGLVSFDPWATIRLKNTLLDNNNWYQKLDIFLDSFPRNIVPIDNEVWTLTAAPLIFMDDKKIIVLTNQDIDEGIEVHILKNIGTFAFLRNEVDLIITNALSHPTDYCTIICSQFYQLPEMKKKMISATLNFFDKIIRLRSYQEEIKHAIHFSKLTFNATTPINSFFLSSIANQNQKPQQTLRRKRQVDPNEKQLINPLSRSESPNKTHRSEDDQIKHPLQLIRNHKEDRILAIADTYLEKYDHAYAKNKPDHSKKNLKHKKHKKIKNKKINSLMSTQEKTTPIEKNQSSNQKNNNYFKRTHPTHLTQNKLTLSTNSKTEKRLRLPFFSKSKTSQSQPKEISLKTFNSDKKINAFTAIKPTYSQERLNSTTKAIAFYPAYQQNQSGSKKNKPYSVSSHLDSPNLHSTLLLLEFSIRKSLKNPISPVFFNKKLNKTFKKIEPQKDRIKSKVFGIQKLQ